MVTKIEFADHQFRFQFDALDQYDQSHVCACSSSTALKNQSKFLPGLFVGLSFALIFNGIGSRRSRSPISNFLGVMHNSTFFLLLHIFPDLHSWKFALYYANTTSEHVPKNLDNLDNFGVWHEAYSFPFQQLAFIAFFLPIYLPFTIVFLPLLFPLLFARRVGFFLQHFFHPRGLEKRRLRHRAWRLLLLSFSILRLTRVWFFAWARHFDLFAKKGANTIVQR